MKKYQVREHSESSDGDHDDAGYGEDERIDRRADVEHVRSRCVVHGCCKNANKDVISRSKIESKKGKFLNVFS